MENMKDYLNYLKTIVSIKSLIMSLWKTKGGFIVLNIALISLYLKFIFVNIQNLNFFYIEYWGLIFSLLILFIIWNISTNRILFRDRLNVLIWLGLCLTCYYLFMTVLYPIYLPDIISNIFYIQYWGGLIFCIPILYIKNKWFINKDLIIILMINVDDDLKITQIEPLIDEPLRKIPKSDNNIRIYPCYNLKKNDRELSKFLRKPLLQADGVITFNVMSGKVDGKNGYIFHNFRSIVNLKRYKTMNTSYCEVINGFLCSYSGNKNWKCLDHGNMLSKLEITNNIEGLICLYLSIFYMLTNDHETAIPIAKNLYSLNKSDQSGFTKQAEIILKEAYKWMIMNHEYKTKDYSTGYEKLKECCQIFPDLRKDYGCQAQLARLAYYTANIESSVIHTDNMNSISKNSLGVCLNRGFYSIINNDIVNLAKYYRVIIKKNAYPEDLITQVIDFLYKQYDDQRLNEKTELLDFAIAILTRLFINMETGESLINNFIQKNNNKPPYAPLFEICEEAKKMKRLKVRSEK